MKPFPFKYLLSLLVISFVGFLIFAAANREEIRPSGFFLHQNYIEKLYRFPEAIEVSIDSGNRQVDSRQVDLNLENGVFWYVFSQLPEEVTIYPSENYYYFGFSANTKNIWGNIRLSPPDRDRGILHFAYWESENESSIDSENQYIEKLSKYKQFSQKDGLRIQKFSDLRYAVTYKSKTVIFNLYDLPQTPPKLAKLRDNEVFVQRTFDESGFRFFLVFQEDLNYFMYILDEDSDLKLRIYPNLQKVENKILIDGRTGFAFYDDRENNRKILIGVSAENIRKNNYFDGPFDQLADNYVASADPPVGYYIEKVYPYNRGRIDDYGKFLDVDGSRVAITPYHTYESIEELNALIGVCQKIKQNLSAEFYSCITLDEKERQF